MEDVTDSQKRYLGQDQHGAGLKLTARAVIKQLETLDKKNLFKLKSETESWIQGVCGVMMASVHGW